MMRPDTARTLDPAIGTASFTPDGRGHGSENLWEP